MEQNLDTIRLSQSQSGLNHFKGEKVIKNVFHQNRSITTQMSNINIITKASEGRGKG